MTATESAEASLPLCLTCGWPTDPETELCSTFKDGTIVCERCSLARTEDFLATAIHEALDGKEVCVGPDPARVGRDVLEEDYDDECLDAVVSASFDRDSHGRLTELLLSVPPVGRQQARRFRVYIVEEAA
jgi:hypothetical protein